MRVRPEAMTLALVVACTPTPTSTPTPASAAPAAVTPETPPVAGPDATEPDEPTEPDRDEAPTPLPSTTPPADWPEIELTAAPGDPCAKIRAPREGQQLCHSPGERGPAIDDMTDEELGQFTVRGVPDGPRRIAYDRVRTEGAAGSRYETYFDGTIPVLVLHRCRTDRRPTRDDDAYDPCGVRFPP